MHGTFGVTRVATRWQYGCPSDVDPAMSLDGKDTVAALTAITIPPPITARALRVVPSECHDDGYRRSDGPSYHTAV